MSKELEAVGKISLALKISKGLFEDIFASEPTPIKPTLRKISNAIKSIPLIETALKRLERHDNIRITEEQAQWLVDNFANLQKKLKALEIIKTHILNRDMDTSGVYLEYHSGFYEPYYTIEIKEGVKQVVTQEEFDSLKEGLL